MNAELPESPDEMPMAVCNDAEQVRRLLCELDKFDAVFIQHELEN